MKVAILKKNKRVVGNVGEVVECDSAIGHALAGVGSVRIVEHDKPGKARCTVQLADGVERVTFVRDTEDEQSGLYATGGEERPVYD